MISWKLIAAGVAIVGVLAFIALAFRIATKRGAERERRRQAETTAEILEDQRDAVENAPDDRDADATLDRL